MFALSSLRGLAAGFSRKSSFRGMQLPVRAAFAYTGIRTDTPARYSPSCLLYKMRSGTRARGLVSFRRAAMCAVALLGVAWGC